MKTMNLRDRVAKLEAEMATLKDRLAQPEDKNLIRQRIRELDLNQTEIARKLNLDRSAITYLINGKRQIKAQEVLPLAEILQIEPIELLKESQRIWAGF
jgi:plasmid maintenance system antidote protein VapI